jgi:hypothetical protein
VRCIAGNHVSASSNASGSCDIGPLLTLQAVHLETYG